MPRSLTFPSFFPVKARWWRATARLSAWAPGGVLYCDDVTGKGHVTRSITDLSLAFINRAGA